MNFSSDSIKHESKNQNEDFYIDLETPRGHFFAVIDFDTHDFANLNATLKGKLETIVNSFVSISRFSADLFLGFLAKEINNFLHNLREQAGGPQLVASAALCLLSGNRLTYLVFGSVGITIHNPGRSTALQTGQSAAGNQLQRLGRRVHEVPLTEEVQTLTLEDDDVALILTEGVASVVDSQTLHDRLANVSSSDASAIRDVLMHASVAGKYDRTVLVITGPYERYVDPVLFDLSRAVAALEARVDEIGKGAQQANVVTVSSPQDDEAVRRMEDRLISRIEVLRDDLRDKAGSIDLLELDEKVKSVAAVVVGKADKADVLSVQSDLLKLSVAADVPPQAARIATDQSETTPAYESNGRDPKWQRSFLMKVAGIVLVIGFGSAFAGAWLQSRLMKRTANTAAASVVPALPVIQPSPTPAVQPAPTPAEIAIKPGDSLRKLAQQYNVPEQTIMDLNPTVTRWAAIQVGQKILVPATQVAVASPQTQNATSVAPGTIEVVVGPGDSINRFAQRYGTTPERIRELNPQITNWSSIRTGQKVLLPSPPSG